MSALKKLTIVLPSVCTPLDALFVDLPAAFKFLIIGSNTLANNCVKSFKGAKNLPINLDAAMNGLDNIVGLKFRFVRALRDPIAPAKKPPTPMVIALTLVAIVFVSLNKSFKNGIILVIPAFKLAIILPIMPGLPVPPNIPLMFATADFIALDTDVDIAL